MMEEQRQEETAEEASATAAEAAADGDGRTPADEAAQDAASTAGDAALQEDGEEEDSSQETMAEAIARLESDLAEARAQADEYLDRMQRTAADYQNARKRQERQLQDSIDRATEGMVRRLLPVLDDFELAFKNVPAGMAGEETAWVEGFERIQQKLIALLADEVVTPMATEGPFDPNRHEAVSHEPNDEVESGNIIETLRTGYEHRERVLRPALVRVAQ